jgi:uncharacterized protein DUF4350
MQLTAGDRKILGITGGIFVAMVLWAVLANRGANSEENLPSIYSTASRGTKAAFLLLKQAGYRTNPWEQSLTALAGGEGKILILAEPMGYPEKDERSALETFLKDGGVVLATGRFSGFFLPQNDAELDSFPVPTWKPYSAIGISSITRAAPEISLAPYAHWLATKSGVPLYGDPQKPVVIEYEVGKGRVLWMGASTPLTNAGVKQTGNLEFLLAVVGAPGEKEILWDEFVHGYEGATRGQAWNGMLGWIALQLCLCAIAVLLAFSRRSAPTWTPAAEVRLSPLEFVRTLGHLYEHANAASVAVEVYGERFRYLLTRRLGLPVTTSVEELEVATRRRWGQQDKGFADALRESDSLRYDPNVSPKQALKIIQTLTKCAERWQLIAAPRKEKASWKPS